MFEQGTAANFNDLFDKLRVFLEDSLPLAERWVPMRTTGAAGSTAYHESIWKAPGLSGTEEIYVGMYTYSSVSLDYYNWAVNGFTGYVSDNTFAAQPGLTTTLGIPLWNQPIPYIFVGNGQRVIVTMNIQNNYQTIYLGKFLPYATPSQYPYPIFVGGMLTSAAATRYDDINYSSWWKGGVTNSRMRFVNGAWSTPQISPFYLPTLDTLRNTKTTSGASELTMPGFYGIHSLVLTDASNNYGELDGIYFISGFSNTVENILTIDAINYYVIRDVWRTGFRDFVAIKLA